MVLRAYRWLPLTLLAIALGTPGGDAAATKPDGQTSSSPPSADEVFAAASAAFDSGSQDEVIAILGPNLAGLRTRLGDTHPDVLTAREQLAFSRHVPGESDEAFVELAACLKARLAAGQASDLAVIHVRDMIGRLYYADGKWAEAVTPTQEALAGSLARTPIDEDATLKLEITLASIWGHLGLSDRAVALFQHRHDRFEQRLGPDDPATLTALQNYTRRLQEYGDAREAETALVDALGRTTPILGSDHRVSRRMQIDLARTQMSLQRFTEAITTLRPALDGIEPARHGLETVVAGHATMATLLATVGDPAWRDWIDRGVDVVKAVEGPDSFQLTSLYHVVVSRGAEEGISTLEYVVSIAEDGIRLRRLHSGLSHPKTIETELQLVRLQLDADQLAAARESLERITAKADNSGDVAAIMLQHRLAELLFDEGDLEAALKVRRSMAQRLPLLPTDVVGMFDIVNELTTSWILLRLDRREEARLVVERNIKAINQQLLENLTQNGEAALLHLIQQWDVALHLMLSIRQEATFDKQNWEDLLVWRGLGPRLLAHRARRVRADPELWKIYQRRSKLRRRLADRVGHLSVTDSPEAQTLADVEAQRAEADRLEETLLARMGPPPSPQSLAPTMAKVCATLPKRTTLVHFVTWTNLKNEDGEKSSYDAFLLNGRDCRVTRVPLGRASEIDDAVTRWRRVITAEGAPPEYAAQAGEQVSQHLLAPLLRHLNRSDRLVIVPEDALALVAWNGLPHPGKGYLVEHFEITTAQDVSEVLRPQVSGRATPKTVLVGDVDYGEAPLVATSAARSGENEEDGEGPIDRFACFGGHFSPLPGTISELDAVGETIDGPIQRLQGPKATPDAVREAIDGASHIHFATHGFFLDERCLSQNEGQADALLSGTPLARSGLALSGANDRPTAQGDGLLSAEEFLDLDLSETELVVLSACETGRGALTQGQGVMGLRWALSLAGARNQVVSLWPIPDVETSALMVDFYQALGPSKPCRRCTVAGALQYAQVQALQRQRREGPVDVRTWAAFEASGHQGRRK